MAGRIFSKGRLVQAFRDSLTLDDAGKRQLKAGLAATGIAYAALGVLCAVDPNVSYMLIKQFSWQQLPLHGLFIMASNLAGAAGFAAYEHYSGRKPAEGDAPAPQPKEPSIR